MFYAFTISDVLTDGMRSPYLQIICCEAHISSPDARLAMAPYIPSADAPQATTDSHWDFPAGRLRRGSWRCSSRLPGPRSQGRPGPIL